MSRLLTPEEIEDILDFITPQKDIPEITGNAIANNIKNDLRKQLEKQKVYPEIIPELKKEMIKQYHTTKIQAGESVGIICAQSIGEMQTQTTLNSIDWGDKILYTKENKAIVEPIGKMIDNLLDNTSKGLN